MRRIFLIILSLLVVDFVKSQSQDFFTAKNNQLLFPSPKAWAFVNYGDYPISYYSGGIQIDESLFQINVNDFKFPVNISYSFLENKPSTVPSLLGLGFSLKAGAAVTRVVKGFPDDKNGYYQNGGSLDVYNSNRSLYINDVMTGLIDSESDIYYYNIGDFSGSFYFDQNKNIVNTQANAVKIVPNFVGNSLVSFQIVAPNGIIYNLNNTEVSQYNNGTGLSLYNSAWYLSNIQLQNGEKIEFEYYPNSIDANATYINAYSKSQTAGVISFQVVQSLENTQIKNTRHYETYLKKITFPLGKLEFDMTPRSDKGGEHAKKLSSIGLYDYLGAILKKYDFEYIENQNERLKLSKIYESNGIERKLFRGFGYNNTKLPWNSSSDPYFTNQVDYWGYYNGQGTNESKSMVPQTVFDGKLYGEAIRSANVTFAQAEILNKINYPTGGFTEFQYELNDFSDQGESFSPYDEGRIEDRSFALEYEDGEFLEDPYNLTFKLEVQTIVTLYKSIKGAGPNTKWVTANTTSESKDVTLNPGIYNVGTLLNANYLQSNDNSDVLSARGSVSYKSVILTPIGAGKNGQGAGLRISKIINNDGVKNSTKKLFYTDNIGEQRSSGILTLMPSFVISANQVINGSTGVFMSSSPILSYNESELIGYSCVIQQNDDLSYTKFYYSTLADYPDGVVEYEIGNTTSLLKSRYSNRDLRGKLIKQELYNASGTLLRTLTYTYQLYNDVRTKNIEFLMTMPLFPVQLKNHENNIFINNDLATFAAKFPRNFYFNPLVREKITDLNNNTNTETVKNFAYTNMKHPFETSVSIINSKGAKITDFTTFPLDYKSGFSELINKNILSIPIENVLVKDDNGISYVLKGTLNEYQSNGTLKRNFVLPVLQPIKDFKFSNLDNGVVPPSIVYSDFLKDLNYEINIKDAKYDNYLNIIEMQESNKAVVSYLWGYRGHYPIAEIKNATYAEVVAVLTQPVIDNLNLISVSENTINNAITKLRTAIPKAIITSYSYKPFIGMASKTDSRGVTEYYKYDGMQRLQAILDHLNYLKKSFDYHHKMN